MSRRRIAAIAVAATAAATLAVSGAAPASAAVCSGSARPNQGRGTRTDTPINYTVQQNTNEKFAGTYYADGYVFVDGSDPNYKDNYTVRAFIPFQNPKQTVDVYLVVGPRAAESCVNIHLTAKYPDYMPQPPAPVPPLPSQEVDITNKM